jgi:hypothetical protein
MTNETGKRKRSGSSPIRKKARISDEMSISSENDDMSVDYVDYVDYVDDVDYKRLFDDDNDRVDTVFVLFQKIWNNLVEFGNSCFTKPL